MSSAPTDLAAERYLSLTTYKKDGSAKALPVWIADLGDGTMGFTTASSSYKVRRLNNDPRVIVQPSDSRGNVTDGSSPASGTGQVVTGPAFEQVRAKVKAKYGIQYRMITWVGKAAALAGRGSGTDAAVIITLD